MAQPKSGAVSSGAKVKTAANALTTTLAVIGAIVGLNVIFTRVSTWRFDLTEDRVYKLSKVSKETVSSLPDRMVAKVFVSGALPPPLNAYGQYIRDLLEEYAAASGGKLTWEAIDPTAPGKDAEETRKNREEFRSKYKIRPITLEVLKENKLEIGSDNFLAVALIYGEQIESIPQVASTEGLEYQVTSLMRKLIRAKQKKLGFATSEGALSPQQGLQVVSRIAQDYEAVPVQLDKPVPEDLDALMVIGPKQPFNDKAKYYLDQHLMRGKGLGLFVDGMVIEAPQGMQMPGMDTPRLGRANDVALEDLLGKYGIKLREDLILDEQNAPGPVPVEGQLYLANYPTFVGIAKQGLAEKFDLTNHLEALILPFASSVELVGEAKEGKAPVKITPLIKSSGRSWRQNGFFVFNPQVKLERSQEVGPFTLGYALEGKLKSAYPNGPGAGGASTPETEKTLKEATDQARLVVVGSSNIFSDNQLPIQQVPIYRSNLLFFLNTVDWLVHDEALIALRVKGMGARPLTIPPDAKPNFWRYVLQIGIPALVTLLGLVLWRIRTSRRRAATV